LAFHAALVQQNAEFLHQSRREAVATSLQNALEPFPISAVQETDCSWEY
jgi:hypothetical protein